MFPTSTVSAILSSLDEAGLPTLTQPQPDDVLLTIEDDYPPPAHCGDMALLQASHDGLLSWWCPRCQCRLSWRAYRRGWSAWAPQCAASTSSTPPPPATEPVPSAARRRAAATGTPPTTTNQTTYHTHVHMPATASRSQAPLGPQVSQTSRDPVEQQSLATRRQIDYLATLLRRCGADVAAHLRPGLTKAEATVLIEELLRQL
ncbi:unnamed protein product [Polarella glacialis]|uniref:Uncharacterized protein n=1 Tax=Polarella glacialis TaxID=89957 RepID=A0A813KF60_POLGL|nr:unnamed protein product [Polarella glacialis]CAE8697397.1 unnamed protein product [Polarella glacialis]CAE8726480.1 unnamed protein product [Polarella glacialis]